MGTYPAVAASLGRLRHEVRSHAEALGANGVSAIVAQASSEAAANAVVHAYDGGDDAATIEVVVERTGDRLHVTVADRGTGFVPRRHTPGLGFGLALIASLADEMQVRERDGGGTEVWMCFRV